MESCDAWLFNASFSCCNVSRSCSIFLFSSLILSRWISSSSMYAFFLSLAFWAATLFLSFLRCSFWSLVRWSKFALFRVAWNPSPSSSSSILISLSGLIDLFNTGFSGGEAGGEGSEVTIWGCEVTIWGWTATIGLGLLPTTVAKGLKLLGTTCLCCLNSWMLCFESIFCGITIICAGFCIFISV